MTNIPKPILDALNSIESSFPDVSVSDEQSAEYFSDVRYTYYNELYPAISKYFERENANMTNANLPSELINALNEFEQYGIDSFEFPESHEFGNEFSQFKRGIITILDFSERYTKSELIDAVSETFNDRENEFIEFINDKFLSYRNTIHKQFDYLKTDIEKYFEQFGKLNRAINVHAGPDFNGNLLNNLLNVIRGNTERGLYNGIFEFSAFEILFDYPNTDYSTDDLTLGLIANAIGLLLNEFSYRKYGTFSEYGEHPIKSD